jgi:pimeloyl-ACP methyl ester carboxylesterase
MSTAHFAHYKLNYELVGDSDLPVITFLNGLTQNVNLWKSYAEYFVPRGYRVLAYDMLGQGKSSKPVINIGLNTHADMLDSLLDQLDIERTHLVGISFGGIIALDFAIRHGQRLHSLTAMSTFAELTPQLEFLGMVMLQGLMDIGLPYLQSMLYPMNMSSAWIAANRKNIPAMKRSGYIGNDGYALQNLMESFIEFKPLTSKLHQIKVPTLIMNGEFDFFTPRECHELIRSKIHNSRLLIVPRAYHAFTLEMPAITMRQVEEFLERQAQGTWQGDQSVWIASDNPAAKRQWLECDGDWMRAVRPVIDTASLTPRPRPARPRKSLSRRATV